MNVTSGGGNTTVTLQRGLSGYTADFDATLNRYFVNSPQGTAATLYLNKADYVPLLRFAIFASEGGPVPDGATIQSATLQLYKQYYNVSVGLFPLLVGWNESQATWNQRQAGVPWTVPGAAGAGTDYSATSDVVVAGGFSPGWMSFDVSGRVQQWGAAVATNFGWRIVQMDSSGQRQDLLLERVPDRSDAAPQTDSGIPLKTIPQRSSCRWFRPVSHGPGGKDASLARELTNRQP